MSKKTTERVKRDADIDRLLDDDCLNQLLDTVDKKHQNGGIFKDVTHHKQTRLVMETLSEEELVDG